MVRGQFVRSKKAQATSPFSTINERALTDKVLLSSVERFMSLFVVFSREGQTTFIAGEWLLTFVCP
jgi:hypothetical protein